MIEEDEEDDDVEVMPPPPKQAQPGARRMPLSLMSQGPSQRNASQRSGPMIRR